MTSRECVYATLDFQGPDRVPTDFWPLPYVTYGREAEVEALLRHYPTDIVMTPYQDPLELPQERHRGVYTDGWGCVWQVHEEATLGTLLHAPLDDWRALSTYTWPVSLRPEPRVPSPDNRFALAGWVRPFERMQDLRGAENLFRDLAEDREELYEVRDRVFAYYAEQVRWLVGSGGASPFRIDGIIIADDWGSQRSMLISPEQWRRFLKPKYEELIAIIRGAGKRVFVHSDGWILDLLPDLIEMGVSAVNSQVFLMGLDRLRPFAGRITFWGELDRQRLLPRGTREDFTAAAQQMVDALWRGGGVIGLSEPTYTLPLERVEWALECWEKVKVQWSEVKGSDRRSHDADTSG